MGNYPDSHQHDRFSLENQIYVVGGETGFQRDIPGSNVLFVPINLTVNGHRYCLDSSQDWSGSPRIDLRHPAGQDLPQDAR